MDNIILNTREESGGSYSEGESSSEEDEGQEKYFMNMIKQSDYEKNRNKIFTKDIEKKRIVIDSHNYYQSSGDFNTSNFDVLFDFEAPNTEGEGTSLITTDYGIFTNVIGFRLLKTTIRTPPYNINSTNNIIRYKKGNSSTIHTITINPGQYEISQLADSFQVYKSKVLSERPGIDVEKNYSQYVTYSDPDTLEYTDNGAKRNTFTLTFLSTEENSIGFPEKNGISSLLFRFVFGNDILSSEVTILWDYDNITRGAARLFGFLPKETKSISRGNESLPPVLYSNRLLDLSSHFVDLVIPEIPSSVCKRNSAGRDIIERIQLKASHGEYLHYRTTDMGEQVYFNPMKLHRINIQLWAVNNELYDTNNSDVSFEFEITMLKNIALLR
tara:strand:+ start:5585 stop:6739 length:1155 start_codon:yes stop_codon:yes gene_type:complete